jgi:hypothetical protein
MPMGPEPKLESFIGPSRTIRGRKGRIFEKGGEIMGIESARNSDTLLNSPLCQFEFSFSE